jgi:hypothetical protein
VPDLRQWAKQVRTKQRSVRSPENEQFWEKSNINSLKKYWLSIILDTQANWENSVFKKTRSAIVEFD